jgi:hypothetical protein
MTHLKIETGEAEGAIRKLPCKVLQANRGHVLSA